MESVVRISHPHPNFFLPGSRVKKIPGSASASASKNLSILTQKVFLSSRKYDPGFSSRIPDLDFLPIPHPGSRGQKGTGSRIRIRNTEWKNVKLHARQYGSVSKELKSGLRTGVSVRV
jgi:hypothetical protein